MPHDTPAIAADGEMVVVEVADRAHLADVAARLDRAEQATGSPLVDEAERDRIARVLAGDDGPPPPGWRPALAWHEGIPVGYLAVVTADGEATGDAAVLLGADGEAAGAISDDARQSVLRVLLVAADRLAAGDGAKRLQVWTRRAGQPEIDVATQAGYEVERHLGVLGRRLDDALPAAPSSSAEVRTYRPGIDDEAVVAVLAAAYADSAEAGWDRERFEERTRLPWFRAEDLLVAELPEDEAGPALAGLHWLKRRDGRTGEVYNLAVHPRAQGHGVGPLLLHAGLVHLQQQGCDDVILWVDRANERAVALYTGQGFETRWDDLALGRAPSDAPAGSAG